MSFHKQSGASCLMLTMMTNYTNHTYNSNNDNISITLIIWIHLNPFRCTGTFGWPWVHKSMHEFTCGWLTYVTNVVVMGVGGIILLRERVAVEREAGRYGSYIQTESSKWITTSQLIKSFPHSVWQTKTLVNVYDTTQYISILGLSLLFTWLSSLETLYVGAEAVKKKKKKRKKAFFWLFCFLPEKKP